MNNEMDHKNYQSAEGIHGKALFFSWRWCFFQLDECSLQEGCVLPAYQVGKIPGLLEPAALCRAPAPLPAACFKVGNDLARSCSVKLR